MDKIISFVRDESGLTTVEYAVAGALVVATLVAAFTDLGDAIEARIVLLTNAIS